MRGQHLGAHQRIALVMVGAPLGMTDDDGAGAGIGQLLGRDIAGMGAGGLRVAILRADRHRRAARGGGELGEQGRRRAHHQVALAGGAAGDDLGELGLGGGKPVHLPIARHQRAGCGTGHL